MELNEVVSFLGSTDENEIIEALKFLQKNGDEACLRQIEEFNNNSSVSLRYYARRAIGAICRKLGLKPSFGAPKKKIIVSPQVLPIPEPIFEHKESIIPIQETVLTPPIRKTETKEEIIIETNQIQDPITPPQPPVIEAIKEEITPVQNTFSDSNDEILPILARGDEAEISQKLDEMLRDETSPPDKKSLVEIKNLLNNTENTFLQSSMVKTLGKFGGVEFIDTIAPFLNSPDFRVVANVIEGFEFINHSSCLKHIAPFLRHDDNRIKANAAKCIWKLDPAKGIMVLKKMISSTEFYYRDSGIYILSQIECEESFDLLLQAYINEDSEELINKIKNFLNDTYKNYPTEKLESFLSSIPEKKQEFIFELLEGNFKIPEINISPPEEIKEELVITPIEQPPAPPSPAIEIPDDNISQPQLEDASIDDISIDISMDDFKELSIDAVNTNETMEEEISINIDMGEFDLPQETSPVKTIPPVSEEIITQPVIDEIEENDFDLNINLDDFKELAQISEPVQEEIPKVEEDQIDDNFDLSVNLDDFKEEEKPETITHQNDDFDLSVDLNDIEEIEAVEIKKEPEIDPKKKFAKKKIVPSGEDLMALLSKKEITNMDELVADDEPEKEMQSLESVEIEDVSADELMPLSKYLRNISNRDEDIRFKAVLGLFHYLKHENISSSEKDEIELYLDMTRGDQSEKIRKLITKNS